MSGNENNGSQQSITVGDEIAVAGVVDRGSWLEISYAPRTTVRPVVGGSVTLEGKDLLVLSSESSPYVRGFVVIKAEKPRG